MVCGVAALAHAPFVLLLAAGFLVGRWYYVLDLDEKWHIKLRLKAAC